MSLQIVLPERSEDAVSDGLRELTAAIYRASPAMDQGYGLGGENGYGANYENDVFMMHRFCWCEREDCPWCSYTGEEGAHFQEKNRQFGALPHLDCGQAPNFWHKRSGFRVIWYKWNGRDNAIEEGDGTDFATILSECIASLPTPDRSAE